MSLPRIAVDAMGGDEGVRVMIEGAAVARRSHDRFKFLLVGAVVLIPMILAYTAYAYWVFRGKVNASGGYH